MAIVIVEIGINHEGSMQTALDLMYAAKWSGASIVKFQLYNPSILMSKYHILWNVRHKIYDIMNNYKELCDYAQELDMKIGFSIFTREFFLANKYVDYIKIAARQLIEYPDFLKSYLKHLSLNYKDIPIFCSYRENIHIQFL